MQHVTCTARQKLVRDWFTLSVRSCRDPCRRKVTLPNCSSLLLRSTLFLRFAGIASRKYSTVGYDYNTKMSETLSPLEKVNDLIDNNAVVIFSKSYCPYCNQVKKLFNELKIPFVSLELDTLGEQGALIQAALIEKTGQKTVPNVFVNRHHIGGCDSTLKAHSDGTLIKLVNGDHSDDTVSYDYDLIVIGGGSGGLAASKEAAQLGKKVAVCDFVIPSPIGTTWGLGGTCVNVGCIPKKLMHQAALLGSAFKDAPYFGWKVPANVEHDWPKMVEEIQQYIKSLNWGYRVALKDKGVVYLNSYAQFLEPNKIKTTDKKSVVKELTAKHFIIAVGGRPVYPDIPGAVEYGITSDDLFSLTESPGKTLLIGASYIALECAGFLAGINLDVTVMVRSILLRGFDRQMAAMIGDHMKSHGIKFVEECIPIKIEKDEGDTMYKVTGTLKDGSTFMEQYKTVVFAVGRNACTKGLGLDEIGVDVDQQNGKINANASEQSSLGHVFAIGDVLNGKPELTPVAIQAGRLLAQRLFNNQETLTDYDNVPTTVFTPLEYGCVGLSEEDAIAKHGKDNIEVFHSYYQPLEFSLSSRDLNKCYAKLICVKDEAERVVGFHVLGPNAGEITQGFAIGLKLGAKKSDFNGLVGIHPTCAEIFTTMNTSKASGLAVDKTSC